MNRRQVYVYNGRFRCFPPTKTADKICDSFEMSAFREMSHIVYYIQTESTANRCKINFSPRTSCLPCILYTIWYMYTHTHVTHSIKRKFLTFDSLRQFDHVAAVLALFPYSKMYQSVIPVILSGVRWSGIAIFSRIICTYEIDLLSLSLSFCFLLKDFVMFLQTTQLMWHNCGLINE